MWNTFIEILSDALLDSLKTLPFLLLCFALLEFLEHRAKRRTLEKLEKTKHAGPVLGAVFGVIPQCGFSVVASNLYAGGAISIGTLIAVFLSTSDEALAVMLSSPAFIPDILIVMAIKVVLAVIFGYIIDLLFRGTKNAHIHKIEDAHAEHDAHCHDGCGCSCDTTQSFIKAVLRHALSIWVFIFIISLVLGFIIELAGTEILKKILLNGTAWQPLLAALVGLIPNCTSSVLLSELYMDGVLSMASLTSGLCAATGLGVLTLFRVNKPIWHNIAVLSAVYALSILTGYAVMLFIP